MIRIKYKASISWQILKQYKIQLIREKKCAVNALFVFVVFLACYIPQGCVAIYLLTNGSPNSLLVAEIVTVTLMFLNSSLNPLIYCWRYREIREIVKSTVKKIFRISDAGT